MYEWLARREGKKGEGDGRGRFLTPWRQNHIQLKTISDPQGTLNPGSYLDQHFQPISQMRVKSSHSSDEFHQP